MTITCIYNTPHTGRQDLEVGSSPSEITIECICIMEGRHFYGYVIGGNAYLFISWTRERGGVKVVSI